MLAKLNTHYLFLLYTFLPNKATFQQSAIQAIFKRFFKV